MNKKIEKQKMYLVFSSQPRRRQGVFPHTPQGKQLAESYVNKLKRKSNDGGYFIDEK